MSEKRVESPSRRISLRNRGELPTSPSATNKDSPVKELKMLARSGGCRGKLYDDTTEWDYFPDNCSVTSSDDEDEVHKDIPFTSIKDASDPPHDYENDDNRLQDDCNYQLVVWTKTWTTSFDIV